MQPSIARCLWRDRSSDRSPSRSPTKIISFRILKSGEHIPGILKASICCEPFEKIVGTTLQQQLHSKLYLSELLEGFVGLCS